MAVPIVAKKLLMEAAPKIAKAILGVILVILVFITICCSGTGYKAMSITVQEVIQYFRPSLVIDILPKLESGSYKEKILYATYIELFLNIYQSNDTARKDAVQRILNSEFYETDHHTYTAELNDDTFFDNVESNFNIEIANAKRQKIIQIANRIDLTNKAQELADRASALIAKNYLWFNLYEPINGRWDAVYVAYCCDKAGYIADGYYKKTTEINESYNECKKTGKFKYGYKYGNEYIPFPGDIVFLNTNEVNTYAEQMGIVVHVEGDTIKVAVGDAGLDWRTDIVAYKHLRYNSSLIIGYYPISAFVNESFIIESTEANTEQRR